MQELLVIAILVAALVYIAYRAYKKITKKKCGDKDCGCK
ncbi:MAG: FeoB-associated Cys-rich membrane protein [Burkholderiales bacterium]|nr:FeoB-associated Cys-rich membrane protein [Bacteroidia bacterium]